MNIEYIAGFFDGEGSVANSRKNGIDRYLISIPQTNLQILEEIRIFLGVGSVYSIKKRKEHWKDAWVYRTTNRMDTLTVLRKIVDSLIIKKSIALTAINYLENYKRKRLHLKKVDINFEKKVLNLIEQGDSYRKIGKDLNISRQTVYKIKKKSENVV